ncbi:PIG-L deacetylase family protein [Kitasatospora sp. NPDC127121]|uniref:PIG-L deacetylase family protein n=1 Tax=Kitasatospora sp. NPDC127121 TaxID=3345371 RepID=UPI00364369A9
MFNPAPGDRALVVAPHPDDESLGLAGTIAKLTGHGVRVDVLAVALTSGPMHGGHSDATTRTREFTDACDVLGVKARTIAWVDDPRAANPAAHLPDLVQLIEAGPVASLATSRPHVLFLPAADAHHQDHQAVHAAGLAAARPALARHRHVPWTVLGYDGPEDRAYLAPKTTRPLIVDTSSHWPAKRKALECYATQLRLAPHPRSLEKIHAQDEAAGAAIGTGLAERFAIYRMAA